MTSLFKSSAIKLSTKIRLLRCCVFSVLYGVESWTLPEATSKKLKAFELGLCRRILKIAYTDHITNEDVLRPMNKELEIMETVKVGKLEYLGHIMRNYHRYELLQQMLQGKLLEKGDQDADVSPG